jgi:light-regulated signal transduction histidine kinase (bacteriophytochrome)
MDPLSIAASVVGILGAADQCVKGIAKLRALKQASSELSALINEIADLQTVLTQVIALSQQLQGNFSDGSIIALKSLLKRAEEQLLAFNALVQGDLSKPKSKRSGGGIRVDHLGWTFNKDHLASVQQGLRTTRLNLATALGVVNS